jgi:CRISPR-associated protein Cas2
MKRVWLICYDISDDKRRTRIYRVLEGFGLRLQYSVWRCLLDRRGRIELEAALCKHLHHREDQILLIDLGPENGRGQHAIDTLGRLHEIDDNEPMIF